MSPGIMMKNHEASESIDQAMQELRGKVAVEQALDSLRGWLAYERSKREEWFEAEDPEMYAYHRGCARGLERGIAAVETVLRAASLDLK